MPALVAQGISVFEIAGLIAFDLRLPEIDAGFREPEVLAILMSVPEAAVEEEGLIDD